MTYHDTQLGTIWKTDKQWETMTIQLMEALHEPIDEDTLQECFIDRTVGLGRSLIRASDNLAGSIENILIELAQRLDEFIKPQLKLSLEEVKLLAKLLKRLPVDNFSNEENLLFEKILAFLFFEEEEE